MQEPTPREELGVGEVVATRGNLATHGQFGGLARAVLRDRVGGAQQPHIHAVCQQHHRNDLAGFGAVENVGQHHTPLCRTRVADGCRQIVGHRLSRNTTCLDRSLDGARVQSGEDRMIDVAGCEVRTLERIAERIVDERCVGVLAETLFPLFARRLARLAPTVGELGGRTRTADDLRDDAVVPETKRRGGVATACLIRAAGKTRANVGQDRDRIAVAGAHHRRNTTANRADRVDGCCRRGKTERRVNRVRIRLVEVRGIRGGKPQRAWHPVRSDVAQRDATRLDRHRRRVLVEAGDRALALSAARAERLRDDTALQAPVRDVGPVSDDSGHVGTITHTAVGESSEAGRRNPCRNYE